MGRWGRLVSLVAVSCAVLGAYNVFADASGLERVAREQVCPAQKPPCRARLSSLRRTPFSQAFVFAVTKSGPGPTRENASAAARVICRRAYVLVGPYLCAREGAASSVREAAPPTDSSRTR